MSSLHRPRRVLNLKALTPMGSRLVLHMPLWSEELLDKEDECPSNHSSILLWATYNDSTLYAIAALISKPSIFKRLSVTLPSNLVKRCRARKKRSFSDVEYPEVTFNIVGPSTTLSKSKGKQLAINFEESNVELSSDLKEILIEPEGIYQYTQIRTGIIDSVDYNALARGAEASDEHSAIAKLNCLTL